MATIGGSNIVTDGLVLALDAANPRSYVSGSSTWNDLSGNNNSGSLVNGPTFSSANNGSFTFNGSTQYVDCGLSTFQPTALTLSTWVSRSSLNDGTVIGRGNINSPTELGISFGYNPSFGPGGIYPADYYITGRITTSTNQLLYPYPTSSLNTFHKFPR